MTTPMTASHDRLAIGLMSGTSLDGIDAAIVITDGDRRAGTGAAVTRPYEPALGEALRGLLGAAPDHPRVLEVERALTEAHAEAVADLLKRAGLTPAAVDVIGFHGHTLCHAPERRWTWQIGDGARLAALTGIDVVADLRGADVARGGQGAPLVPLWHRALAAGLDRPLAVVNIGGVANVTWLGAEEDVLAFDTGPGNALIDDWVRRHGGGACDRDGALARSGRVDGEALAALLDNGWFAAPPPKSLDRDHFDPAPVATLSPADGAATLTAFTAAAIARARAWLPAAPVRWLVTGGGRHNPALMAALGECLGAPVAAVESVGWDGDALEAQAFGYLAVRSLIGAPLTLPTTTGVPAPCPGGRLYPAAAA